MPTEFLEEGDDPDELDDYFSSLQETVNTGTAFSNVRHFQAQDKVCYIEGENIAYLVWPITEELLVRDYIARCSHEDDAIRVTDLWPEDMAVIQDEKAVYSPPTSIDVFEHSHIKSRMFSLNDLREHADEDEVLLENLPRMARAVLQDRTVTEEAIREVRPLLLDLLSQPDDSDLLELGDATLFHLRRDLGDAYRSIISDDDLADTQAVRKRRTATDDFIDYCGDLPTSVLSLQHLHKLRPKHVIDLSCNFYCSYLDSLPPTTSEEIVRTIVIELTHHLSLPVQMTAKRTLERLGYQQQHSRWVRKGAVK